MILTKIVVLPTLAALIAFAAMPVVRKLSRRAGAVAVPGGRRVHNGVIPLGGGIAIFLGFLIAVLFFNNNSPEIIGFLIGATIIVSIGFLDDIFELPAIVKFLGQILATLVVIVAGIQVEFIGNLGNGNDGIYYLGFLSIPFTFFWIIGITNAINFLDGVDGLAGGVSGISAFTLGVAALISGRYDAAVLCFILGAVALAFLPYNFSNNNNRKMFMGDSGSSFLGFSLAVLSVIGMTKVAATFSMLVPIVILAMPIIDTIFVIIRRILSGKSPFKGDRTHLHYKIMDNGFSDRQTVFFIYGITMVLSALAICFIEIKDTRILVIFSMVAAAVIMFLLGKIGLFKKWKRKNS